MDPLITAIIAGTFSIIASIVTLFLTRYLDNRSKAPISMGRRKAITGQWVGVMRQDEGPKGMPLDSRTIIDLIARRKTIVGTLTLQPGLKGDKPKIYFSITGEFFYSRFLRINNAPLDGDAIQFGCAIFELNSEGNILLGKFAGYGKRTEKILSGTVTLNKVQ